MKTKSSREILEKGGRFSIDVAFHRHFDLNNEQLKDLKACARL
jgi:hypothetical protein